MSYVEELWSARLENWALWYVGGESSGVSSYNAIAEEDTAPRPPPPLIGEAVDTDALLVKLNAVRPELFEAVRAWYVWTGTKQMKARQMGIHPDTLADRVRAAKYRLESLEGDRKAAMTRIRQMIAA